MYIPAGYVAISLALAGIAWLFFARSQSGRKQSGVLAWLALPFFIGSMIYCYFSLYDVEISTRALYARWGFIAISLPQAIILIYLSYTNRGRHAAQ